MDELTIKKFMELGVIVKDLAKIVEAGLSATEKRLARIENMIDLINEELGRINERIEEDDD